MLNHYEIAKAFPECEDIARRNLSMLKKEVAHYKDDLLDVFNSDYTEEQKVLSKTFIKFFMSQNPKIKQINRLEQYLKLIKTPDSNQKLDIPKAKLVPIQSLHDFQKQKLSYRRMRVICPFHDDKDPSLVIYLESNTWHCFTCGVGGDSISFFMKLNNVNFLNAVRRMV